MGSFVVFVLVTFAIAAGVALVWYTQYWNPKVTAFKTGSNRVPIWFGAGELILWNPGQAFAFLSNKQLALVGDKRGGYRPIYAFKGEEAIGPIQLQSALFNWEDQNVLTRDGQILSIKVGVWWHVEDAEKYVFQIYSDAKSGTGIQGATTATGTSRNAGFNFERVHLIADSWLRVITESTIRAKLSTLTVAEVVSSQAMEFLHYASDVPPDGVKNVAASFEAAVMSVLSDVQIKARNFGVEVEQLEVQHIHLPKEIQDAINETRIAFLAPIRSEREAEAQRITLEKLASVLGRDTVGLNEIMKNFKNANFMTPTSFLQPLFDSTTRKAEKIGEQGERPKQLADS